MSNSDIRSVPTHRLPLVGSITSVSTVTIQFLSFMCCTLESCYSKLVACVQLLYNKIPYCLEDKNHFMEIANKSFFSKRDTIELNCTFPSDHVFHLIQNIPGSSLFETCLKLSKRLNHYLRRTTNPNFHWSNCANEPRCLLVVISVAGDQINMLV